MRVKLKGFFVLRMGNLIHEVERGAVANYSE